MRSSTLTAAATAAAVDGATSSGKKIVPRSVAVAGPRVKGTRKVAKGGFQSAAAQLAYKAAHSNPKYTKLLSSVRHQLSKLTYEQHLLEVAGQDGKRAG